MALELRPIGTREASFVVSQLHRHLPRVVGGLFAVAAYEGDELVGVGVMSLPKATLNRDGFTAELSRIATDGSRNACTRITGALCRAAAAIGVRRVITYTRPEEPGTSLRAAGFVEQGLTREQSWDRPRRPRDGGPSQVRRWVRMLTEPKRARLEARRNSAQVEPSSAVRTVR